MDVKHDVCPMARAEQSGLGIGVCDVGRRKMMMVSSAGSSVGNKGFFEGQIERTGSGTWRERGGSGKSFSSQQCRNIFCEGDPWSAWVWVIVRVLLSCRTTTKRGAS